LTNGPAEAKLHPICPAELNPDRADALASSTGRKSDASDMASLVQLGAQGLVRAGTATLQSRVSLTATPG
jgi:hypothetical protein